MLNSSFKELCVMSYSNRWVTDLCLTVLLFRRIVGLSDKAFLRTFQHKPERYSQSLHVLNKSCSIYSKKHDTSSHTYLKYRWCFLLFVGVDIFHHDQKVKPPVCSFYFEFHTWHLTLLMPASTLLLASTWWQFRIPHFC